MAIGGLVDAAPARMTAKAPTRKAFRGQCAASAPAAYASRLTLPSARQGSLPAGWLAFAGRELNPLDRIERFQITCSSSFPGLTLTLHPPLSPPRAAERLPPHPPSRPARRRDAGGKHRARPTVARRGGARAPALARGRQSGRRRLPCATLPVLRRPNDRRRDVRRAARLAVPVAEPDQDRQLMTAAGKLAAHRRSPSPPAASRNVSAMSVRGSQSPCDRRRRLPRAHHCPRTHLTPSLPTKAPNAAGRRRLARPPSATLKSP